MRVPVFSHSCQHFSLPFLVVAIWVKMMVASYIILICLSVMTDNVKHIFNVLVMCIFLKEVSMRSFAIFLIGYLSSHYWAVSSLYILDTIPLSDISSSCFLPFYGLQLYFLDTVFWNKLIYILKVSWFKGGNRTTVFRCGKRCVN